MISTHDIKLFLLFDRLLKGYVSAYLHSHPGRGESYPGIENFTWHAKSFSIEQIPLFSHVADCIISHNIWKADSEEEAKYQEYGLSKRGYTPATEVHVDNIRNNLQLSSENI